MAETKSKILAVDPCAWAKMKWCMHEAGDLEMTGFGVTKKGHPLHVIDFNLVGAEVSTTLTTLDDKNAALAKYVGENAKKGIEPARCMRVWVHSHPFSEGTPAPSGIDNTNLRTKFMNEADWMVMVILGQNGCFAELHTKLQMPGDIIIAIPLIVRIDWMRKIWAGNKKEWGKEFKANVKEEKKTKKDTKIINPNDPDNPPWWQKNYGTKVSEGQELYNEWVRNPTQLNLRDYARARRKGYTYLEVARWGFAVIDESFTPQSLRAAEKRMTKKHPNKNGNKKNKTHKIKNRHIRGSAASRASMGLKSN